MDLSPDQAQELKANIAANTATVLINGAPVEIRNVPVSPDNSEAVAEWYNLTATPAFQVYRSSVPMSEIMLNGFDWTRVDNLSVGKARIWEWMFSADPITRAIDPSKPNIRAGINAVWVGTAADLNVRAAVYAHCHREATRAELLFSTGAGTAPAQDGSGPGTTELVDPLTGPNVMAAWAA